MKRAEIGRNSKIIIKDEAEVASSGVVYLVKSFLESSEYER